VEYVIHVRPLLHICRYEPPPPKKKEGPLCVCIMGNFQFVWVSQKLLSLKANYNLEVPCAIVGKVLWVNSGWKMVLHKY